MVGGGGGIVLIKIDFIAEDMVFIMIKLIGMVHNIRIISFL